MCVESNLCKRLEHYIDRKSHLVYTRNCFHIRSQKKSGMYYFLLIKPVSNEHGLHIGVCIGLFYEILFEFCSKTFYHRLRFITNRQNYEPASNTFPKTGITCVGQHQYHFCMFQYIRGNNLLLM